MLNKDEKRIVKYCIDLLDKVSDNCKYENLDDLLRLDHWLKDLLDGDYVKRQTSREKYDRKDRKEKRISQIRKEALREGYQAGLKKAIQIEPELKDILKIRTKKSDKENVS
jgi:hypothetical protein